MLEIRQWRAMRIYENFFFREFAKKLKESFDKKWIDGLLIWNSFCSIDERLQIDALLVVKNAVCIIDFKNFGWNIQLPDEYNFNHIPWKNDEWIEIKWWSSINPHAQLKNQKNKLSNIIKNNLLGKIRKNGDILDVSHIKKIVCFQNSVNLIEKIPGKYQVDFMIADSDNYLEIIFDAINVIDESVSLSQESIDIFKKNFQADEFFIDEKKNEYVPLEINLPKINREKLYEDQHIVYLECEKFLKNKNEKIFILQGSAGSGKTFLIDYLQELAFSCWFSDVEKIVQSKRVANHLSSRSIQFHGIYSFIYWWKQQKLESDWEEDYDDENNKNDNKKEELSIVEIPLKENNDSEDTLYIVDEAQLISDSYNQNSDMKFGSGKLLKDFLQYTDIKNSSRKIIFIGDVFQIGIGKISENSLNPKNFVNNHSFWDEEIRICQLKDKIQNSLIWDQIWLMIDSMRNKNFNYLQLQESAELQIVNKIQSIDTIVHQIKNNLDFHILTYSNSQAYNINLWIKKNVFHTDQILAEWDLIMFHNNFEIIWEESDIFTISKKIYNWDFAIIRSVNEEIIETIAVQKSNIELKFKKIWVQFSRDSEVYYIYSFENYRLNSKWELSQDEKMAMHILENNEINTFIKKHPFDKSDIFRQISSKDIFLKEKEFVYKLIQDGRIRAENSTQKELKKLINTAKRTYKAEVWFKLFYDKDSKISLIRRCGYIKFWWAFTVHKSITGKWDNILINCNTDWWKNNESYFKWLYTWLTRARKNIYLVNFENVHPFSYVQFLENISNNDKNVYFSASNDITLWAIELNLVQQFQFPEDNVKILMQFYNFVNHKFLGTDINIQKIIHHQYQEIYTIGNNENSVDFQISYNKKWEFKNLKVHKSNNEDFAKKIQRILESENKMKDFWSISDKWRREIYEKISEQLWEKNIFIKYILQSNYKDSIKLSQKWEIIIVDLYYDWDGFFSKIILKYVDNIEIWNIFKNIIHTNYV